MEAFSQTNYNDKCHRNFLRSIVLFFAILTFMGLQSPSEAVAQSAPNALNRDEIGRVRRWTIGPGTKGSTTELKTVGLERVDINGNWVETLISPGNATSLLYVVMDGKKHLLIAADKKLYVSNLDGTKQPTNATMSGLVDVYIEKLLAIRKRATSPSSAPNQPIGVTVLALGRMGVEERLLDCVLNRDGHDRLSARCQEAVSGAELRDGSKFRETFLLPRCSESAEQCYFVEGSTVVFYPMRRGQPVDLTASRKELFGRTGEFRDIAYVPGAADSFYVVYVNPGSN